MSKKIKAGKFLSNKGNRNLKLNETIIQANLTIPSVGKDADQ